MQTLGLKRTIMIIIGLILLTLNPLVVFCQTSENKNTQRRWSFSYVLANTSSGPAKDIEKAMITAGFNDTTPNYFGGTYIQHPFSVTGFGSLGFPWALRVNYLINPRFNIGAMISSAKIGITIGAISIEDSFDFILFTEYSVTTFAPMIFIQVRSLCLGMGPALYFTKLSLEEVSNKTSNIGFLLDVGLTFPAKSRFFIEVKYQYRLISDVEIGSFEVQNYAGDTSVLPIPHANYSHTFTGLGIGLRI